MLTKMDDQDFKAILKEHGPQWSRMYFAPITPEHFAANEQEVKEGLRRVKEICKCKGE